MRGQKEALGVGLFNPTMVVNIKLNIVIVSETIVEPSTPIPKSSVDVAGPSTPPKNLVDVARLLAPPP